MKKKQRAPEGTKAVGVNLPTDLVEGIERKRKDMEQRLGATMTFTQALCHVIHAGLQNP